MAVDLLGQLSDAVFHSLDREAVGAFIFQDRQADAGRDALLVEVLNTDVSRWTHHALLPWLCAHLAEAYRLGIDTHHAALPAAGVTPHALGSQSNLMSHIVFGVRRHEHLQDDVPHKRATKRG